MSQISSKHTPCKNCTFAVYDGITQTGCSLDLLERYKKNKIEILECYDGDKEFYVVNKKKCKFFRQQSWGASLTVQERKTKVIEDTKIQYQVILFSGNDMEELRSTLSSIYLQKHLPEHITVIRPSDSLLRPMDVTKTLADHPIKWRLQNLQSLQQTREQTVHQVLDMTKLKHFIGVFNAGDHVPLDLFSALNTKVIDEDFMFSMISDGEKENLIMSFGVYAYWRAKGSNELTVFENIERHECQNKKQSYTTKQILE